MNSNYQANKFFAQEKMNHHLKAAQIHRQVQKSNSRNGSDSIYQTTVQILQRTGLLVRKMALRLEKLGKANVSPHRPRYQ